MKKLLENIILIIAILITLFLCSAICILSSSSLEDLTDTVILTMFIYLVIYALSYVSSLDIKELKTRK